MCGGRRWSGRGPGHLSCCRKQLDERGGNERRREFQSRAAQLLAPGIIESTMISEGNLMQGMGC